MANAWPAVAVADGWVWITNWLAAAGLTTIELVGDEVKPPPVNLSESVSALLSARFVNVATPPDNGGGGRPLERAGAAGERRRDHRGVVARLQVAVLIHFIDHRLGRERLPGRRRRRRLRLDHQLAGRRRGHGEGARGRAVDSAAGDLERVAGGGRGQRQVGEGGHAVASPSRRACRRASRRRGCSPAPPSPCR